MVGGIGNSEESMVFSPFAAVYLMRWAYRSDLIIEDLRYAAARRKGFVCSALDFSPLSENSTGKGKQERI